MKKTLRLLAIAAISFVLFGCPRPDAGSQGGGNQGGGNSDPTQKTLTARINESDADIDFKNEEIKEDASVDKAKTISNLKMGGKTLTVNVSGVTLKNISDAAVDASEKIGDGDLTIDGCKVEKLTVLGGGSNSINIANTEIKEVSVEKETVRLNLQKDTKIEEIIVAVDNVKIEAVEEVTIEAVTVEEAVEVVTVSGGTIETIKVAGDEEKVPTILITGETTIKAIETVEENVEVKVKVAEEIKEKVELPEEIVPVVVTVEKKYIDASNAKCIYKEGDAFDFTNIYYIEEYSDGTVTKKTLTADTCTLTGFDSSKEGGCTVKIAVGDVSAEFLVKIGSSKIKVDISNEDIALDFYQNEDKTVYHILYDLGEQFDSLPVKGDKVSVTLKGTVSQDLPALYTRLVSVDYTVLSGKNEVLVAENLKAGEEFTATGDYELERSSADAVCLEIYAYENPSDKTCFFESGKGLSNETDHLKVEAGDDGLIITLKLKDGERHKTDNGGDIYVNDKAVRIGVMNENFIQYENLYDEDGWYIGRSETFIYDDIVFYYPFVEKGEACYVKFSGALQDIETEKVTWLGEYAKVIATSGRNLDDYVSPENRKALDDLEVKVIYDDAKNAFTYGFDSNFHTAEDICSFDKLSAAYFETDLLLGKLYWGNPSAWWGGNSTWNTKVKDENKIYTNVTTSYTSGDYFDAARKYSVPYVWHDPTTLADWKKYNNQYCANIRFVFKIDEPKYGTTFFKYKDNWSEQFTYDNPYLKDSTKNLDLEAALLKGIEKVSEDGVISSEEDFMKVIMEAAAEYQESGLFGGNTSTMSRSVVTVPDDKALNIADAYTQIMDFVDDTIKIYKDIRNVKDTLKIDFDHTVNLGELTVSQWFDTVMKVVYEVNNQIGERTGTSDWVEKGPIPEGFDSYTRQSGWDSNDEYYNKYYWTRKEYSDPIEVPDGKYLTMESEQEKWLVYVNEETGDVKKIEPIENGCYFDTWNNTIYTNEKLDSGITDLGENRWDYEWYFDKQNQKCGLINTSTYEITYAPDGFTGYDWSWNYYDDVEYVTFYWTKSVVVKEIDTSDMQEGYEVTTTYYNKNYYGYWEYGEFIPLGEYDPEKWSGTITRNGVGKLYKEIIGDEIDTTGWTYYYTPSIFLGYNSEGVPTYYLYNGNTDMSFYKMYIKNAVKHYTGKSYEEFTAFLDEIITIKNFYLDADVDGSLSYSKLMDEETDPTEKIGSASLATVINAGIADVNKALNTYLSFFEDKDYEEYDLPVKAVSVNIEAKTDTSLAYGDVKNCITTKKDGDEEVTIFTIFGLTDNASTLDAATEVEIKAAVCTATGKGGIITVSLKAESDLSLLLETITGAFIPGEIGKEPTEEQLEAINEQIKKIGSLKVSVSDGTKETWSKDFTYSDIAELIGGFMGK